MCRLRAVFLPLIGLLASSPEACGQTTPGAAASNAFARFWSGSKMSFTGLVDFYGSVNMNHPASQVNQLHNFTFESNGTALNMSKFTLERAASPIGFRIDGGFGKAIDFIHGTEPLQNGFVNRLLDAYVSFKVPKTNGIQIDAGKFMTSAGAELTATHQAWNYSRSLLYANGPYYHFGLRAAVPVVGGFSAGVQVLNGWNNVKDNNNSKTVGITTSYVKGPVTWSQVYLAGEEMETGAGRRHFYDTVLLVNASSRASFYMNFDYGTDNGAAQGRSRFLGIAGATRVSLNKYFAIAPRLEWYHDADGLITGRRQKLKEATLTGEFKLRDNFLTRLEWRRDWSNVEFFDRGAVPGSFRNQSTVLLGMVFLLGPTKVNTP